MSYPRDLDEIPSDELAAEQKRREEATAAGKCDYCGRLGDTPCCRFPARHAAALEVLRRKVGR